MSRKRKKRQARKIKNAREKSFSVFNYCVCFMDLLGQRKSLQGHGIISDLSEEGRRKFLASIAPVILPIKRMQDRTADMNKIVEASQLQGFSAKLTKEQRIEWAQIRKMRLYTQYWSDGLVAFTSLGDVTIKCKMNSVLTIFAMAGIECLTGLASGAPIRGAIDIAWGVELRSGELYGAAIANAYELESEHAHYPRILVSEMTMDYLLATIQRPDNDTVAQYERGLAQACYDMLLKDEDGRYILHYLGEGFAKAVSHKEHANLYREAHLFVSGEYERFNEANDAKLAPRYRSLLSYFEKFSPN